MDFNGNLTSDKIAGYGLVDLETYAEDGEIEDTAFMPLRFENALETVLR